MLGFFKRKFGVDGFVDRFSIQSDHHHLVLSKCDAEWQLFQTLSEIQIESLDEFALIAMLEKFPELKAAQFILLLNDDVFQWQQKAAADWSGLSQQGVDQDLFYIDALQVGEIWHVALLEQASIEAYLAAAKLLKLKWQRIAPISYPKMNFLPYSAMLQKRRYRQKQFLIFSLPILAAIFCFALVTTKTDTLQSLQRQHQHLQQSVRQHHSGQSVVSVSAALPVVQQLWPFRQSLTTLSFTNSTVAHLSGQTRDMHHFNLLLNQLNHLSAIQAESIQHLQVQNQHGEQVWQLEFAWKTTS